MEEPIGKNQEAPNAGREPKHDADNPIHQVSGAGTESKLPVTDSGDRKASKKQRDWYDYAKGVLEIIGLAVLYVYTAYTVKIFRANKSAADTAEQAATTAKDTLILAQRAWVGLDGTIKINMVKVDVPKKTNIHGFPVPLGAHPYLFAASYHIKNFGRGPAFKVHSSGWLNFDTRFLNLDAKGVCESSMEYTLGKRVIGTEKLSGLGTIIFPDQIFTESMGTQDNPFAGSSGPETKMIYVLGCITYLDQFLVAHWTRFCVKSPDFWPFAISVKTPLLPYVLYNDTDDTERNK